MPGAAGRLGARRLAALAIGAGALLGACDGDDGDDVGSPESASPSTVREGPVAATEIAVGDCLDGIVIGAAERAEISSAEVVSCERAHGLEVYATFELTAEDFQLADPAEYPGPVRVVREADQGCADRIEELVEDPDVYGLIALWPSQESWAAGDRDVACAVFAPDGTPFDARQL